MKKINFVDFMVLLVFVFLAIAFFASKEKKLEAEKPMQVTIKVTLNAKDIYPEANKMGNTYFDSVNTPVQITNVSAGTENGTNFDLITIKGSGRVESGRYIFDGVRVLVGQKAELHGRFWAQGTITDVRYAD